MWTNLHGTETSAASPGGDLAAVCSFLFEQGSALANAARLLGGSAASTRVILLCEAVRDAARLTRAHRRQLVALHKLLTLQHVADQNRIESVLFSEIDPSAHVVEEICWLADSLGQVLRDICDNAPAGVDVREVRQHLAQAA
jgi:hypothetical protein